MRTPGQLLRDEIDASFGWQSSIDRRMPPLAPFVHGISINRMECGSCVLSGMFWFAVFGDVTAIGEVLGVDAAEADNVCVFRTADGAAKEHEYCGIDVGPFSFAFASD